jgi:hypothetical protein
VKYWSIGVRQWIDGVMDTERPFSQYSNIPLLQEVITPTLHYPISLSPRLPLQTAFHPVIVDTLNSRLNPVFDDNISQNNTDWFGVV